MSEETKQQYTDHMTQNNEIKLSVGWSYGNACDPGRTSKGCIIFSWEDQTLTVF